MYMFPEMSLVGMMSLIVIVCPLCFLKSFLVLVSLNIMMMLGGLSFSFIWRSFFIARFTVKLLAGRLMFLVLAIFVIMAVRSSFFSYGMFRMMSSIDGFCGNFVFDAWFRGTILMGIAGCRCWSGCG